MTQAEYARRRGVSKVSIHTAVKTGRIVLTACVEPLFGVAQHGLEGAPREAHIIDILEKILIL